jgi:pSer/pThr/pTyr-binding forkhead associated (FHA) protein
MVVLREQRRHKETSMTHERANNSNGHHLLYITEAGRPERTIALSTTMTIGRDNENDIVIDSITVSRCHAVLLRDDAGVRLIDLESTNGTLVNGVPAQPDEPMQLMNGNIIQLGYVWARYCAPL